MAYNTDLEEKIDTATKRWKNIVKKKMFGGVCYLINGNMAFGIIKDNLIVRMDKAKSAESLKARNVRPFDFTGKPLAGLILVQEAGWKKQAEREQWIAIGKTFASSLPEKSAKKKAKKKTLREYRLER